MQINNGTVLKYKLWMRLLLIFGAVMWVAILILSTSTGGSLDIAALLFILFLLLTIAAALIANLSWISYDEQGMEWHPFLRRPVLTGWVEVTRVRMSTVDGYPSHLGIKAPERWILVSSYYDGFKELSDEIARRVPADRWDKQ